MATRTAEALLEAAEARGVRHRAGITWSLDAFYVRNAVLQPDGSMASMSAPESLNSSRSKG